MTWHNVRVPRSVQITPNVKIKSQARHKSRKFLISPSFYPQNRRKSIQQLPRAKSGSVSLKVGVPQFYRRPVIQHNLLQAARENLLRDASAKPKTSKILPAVEYLDPEVEDSVNKEIQKELNFFTSSVVRQYNGDLKHPDIALSIRGYLDRQQLRTEPVKFMLAALHALLPKNSLNDWVETPIGALSHKRFRYMKQDDDAQRIMSRMGLGWYLLRSGTMIRPERLLEDGTNQRFLPGPPTVWPYRLWAGGSITQHSNEPLPVDTGQTIHKTERIVDFRIQGPGYKPERIFVTIQKDYFLIDQHWPLPLYNKTEILAALSGQASTNHSKQWKQPFTSETYTLCFLRDPPDFTSASTSPRIVAPPTLPKFQHTLTPTRHLLFCWSALTYNAHLIHFDAEYTKTIYKAPNLLVHGPLTAFMALEWFERTITQYAIEREFPPFELRGVEYKNLAPLYVDEPLTLCTKPTKFQTPGTLADSWDVWIEKKVVEDNDGNNGGHGGRSTMAFKATVKLAVGDKALERGTRLSYRTAEEADETNGFDSPFFSSS